MFFRMRAQVTTATAAIICFFGEAKTQPYETILARRMVSRFLPPHLSPSHAARHQHLWHADRATTSITTRASVGDAAIGTQSHALKFGASVDIVGKRLLGLARIRTSGSIVHGIRTSSRAVVGTSHARHAKPYVHEIYVSMHVQTQHCGPTTKRRSQIKRRANCQ